jgi:hypothetical protein
VSGGPIAAFLPGEVQAVFNASQTAVRYTTSPTPDGVGDACSNSTKTQPSSCVIIF